MEEENNKEKSEKPVEEKSPNLEKETLKKLSLTEKIKKITLSFLKDKYNLVFLVILFLAFLLRLKYINQESIWNDAAVHLWYAIKVTKEPLFFFSRQYLLGDYGLQQTFMAVVYLFTKNILLAGKIMALTFMALGIIFMYLLGSELRSKFTGLMAAALLAFNHLFWFYSVRPLGDAPLLSMTIVLLYFMVKLEKEKKMIWGISAGITFLLCMFSKRQSVIFVLALFLYYLFFKRKQFFKEKAVLISGLIPFGFVLLAELGSLLTGGSSLLNYIFTLLFVTFRGMPFGFEAAGMLQWIFSWYLVPLVLIGIILIIVYRKKEYYFSLILFGFYWVFFEVGVDNTQDRYMLPLFSVGIILSVFALEEAGYFISVFTHKHVKYLIVIGVIFFLSWNYYRIGDPLIYNKTFSYTGYQEAGQWLKDNVPDSVPIFAGEYRSIRLFTESEFGGPHGPPSEDLGGKIWNLRSPYRYTEDYTNVGKSNFEADVANLSQKSDVYLEIDVWEYAQPSWYWPLTQDSINYFQGQGFKMVKIVERPVLTQDGIKTVPVIFIFKKDKTP